MKIPNDLASSENTALKKNVVNFSEIAGYLFIGNNETNFFEYTFKLKNRYDVESFV